MDDTKTSLAKASYFQPQRVWLNIFFLIALAVIVMMSLISFRQLNNFTTANKWVFHTYEVMQASNKIFLNHLNSVALTRGYLLTGDENFTHNLEQVINEMYKNLALMKKLTADNSSQQKKIAKLESLINERIDVLKKSIQLKKDQKSSPAEEKKFIYLGQELTDKVEAIIEDIYEDEFSLLQQRNLHTEERFKGAMLVVSILNAVSIFLLTTIIILFNRRITEQSLSEEQRRTSEILLKGIINGTNDYIAAVDMNLNYIAFNRTFEEEFKRIFGKKPIIGMSVAESLTLAPNDINPVLTLWNRALKGEEFTIIDKFGQKNIARNEYEVTFNAIYDEQNKLIGASHIARNVAERIEQERSLKIAKEDIEASYSELKKHDTEISTINEMNSALQAASSLDETLAMIKNYCVQLLPFSAGILYIMNSSRNYLEPTITWNKPKINDQVILPDQCWGLRQGKKYRRLDTEMNLPCKHIVITDQILASVCIPLLAQNNIIGLLYLQIKNSDKMPNEQLRQLVDANEFLFENIAGHISLAIANMKLQDALKIRSIRDALTGLYNRSYFDESLYRDIERAKRKNISIAIVMLDLDHFKKINDTFGHEAGDLVLIEIGKILKQYSRQSDIACRYGGEEFLLMLYDVTQEMALKRCEELRKEISQLTINLGETLIEPISASFGVVLYPNDSVEWNKLIAAADQALYKSKNTGRNKITLYE